MRLLSFTRGDTASWGLVAGDGLIDLGNRVGGTLREALERNDLGAICERYGGDAADAALDEVDCLPPIPAPEKIICIGVNYVDRNAEYRDGSDAPRYPSVFMRTPDSLTGHGQPLLRPPESEQLDYEGEIVIVIGRGGHRIAREHALSHVAGLTLMNEGTLRDWVRHAKFNVTQGKNFYHSGSTGPWMVTANEFTRFDDLELTTLVNGERRQHDSTARLMFPFDYLISYLSCSFVLKPGDIISTGTPLGAGARFDPPRYLVPGDEIRISVPGIGELCNVVQDDPAGAAAGA
ncbi:MAG: fumarylacetoacetate hydrolase family protein [Gammaproteobacteria bacterium]|nr:fumarylacetoacetate hydrolase family protein [Gammaproteobacteria bacterium]NNL99822.1 fumarylacetoacetate hydrolase family protein [Gammaproteobacteria bacterium]